MCSNRRSNVGFPRRLPPSLLASSPDFAATPYAALFELGGLQRGMCWEVGGLLPRAECRGRSTPISTIVAVDLGYLQSLVRWRKSSGNAGNAVATNKLLLGASRTDS